MSQLEVYPCPFMVWAGSAPGQRLPAWHPERETAIHVALGASGRSDEAILTDGSLVRTSELRCLHDLPGQANSMAAWIARAVLGAKKTSKLRDCEVSVRQVKVGISIVAAQLGSILITREAADLVLTESYVAAVRVPGLRLSSPELALACTVAGIVAGEAEVRKR